MVNEIPYEALAEGQMYSSAYRVTPEVSEAYGNLVGDGSTDHRVRPWVFCTFLPWYRALGGRPEQGSIHLRQHTELFERASIGEDIQVDVQVIEKRIRKGRRYVSLETLYRTEDRLRCRSTATLLWGYAQR